LRSLVRFNQTKTPQEKSRTFSEMAKLRRRFSAYQLESRQYAYFDAWYFPVIRELVVHGDWKGDFKCLASMLRPPISGEKAREAVETLLNMGLIEKKAEGGFAQSSQAVLADQVPKSVRRHFRMEMLMRGMEALETQDLKKSQAQESKHISGATVAMSEATFKELSAFMDDLRKKVLERAVEDETVERVYQFSFLAFPLSGRIGLSDPMTAKARS